MSTAPVEFLFLEETRFMCVMCGKCCSGWEIPVNHKEATGFREYVREIAGMNASDAILEARNGGLVLANQSKSCIALGVEGRCLIHERHGASIKPYSCRAFPFFFTLTAEGLRLHRSFFCTAILQGTGEKVTGERLGISPEEAVKYSGKAGPLIKLTLGREYNWSEYRVEEKKILDFLSRNEPFEDLLYSISIYLGKNARAGETGSGIEIKYVRPDEEELSRKKLSPSRRALIGLTLGLREAALKDSSTFLKKVQFIINFIKFFTNSGSVESHTLGSTVSLARLARVSYDTEEKEIKKLLTGYFRELVFRVSMAEKFTLLVAWCYMLLFYSMIKQYARMSACARGTYSVTLEDFAKGIAIVEKEFVLHNRFMVVFDSIPGVRKIVERLFLEPSFPGNMIYGQ